MEFFDSHSHYNDEKFDVDREQIIKETYESGITKFVCAGYNIKSSISNTPTLNIYCIISIIKIIENERTRLYKNLFTLNNSIIKYSKGIKINKLPNILIIIE